MCSQRTPAAENTHFAIVAAGGTRGNPEKGDREYHIIAVNSGLYVSASGKLQPSSKNIVYLSRQERQGSRPSCAHRLMRVFAGNSCLLGVGRSCKFLV